MDGEILESFYSVGVSLCNFTTKEVVITWNYHLNETIGLRKQDYSEYENFPSSSVSKKLIKY